MSELDQTLSELNQRVKASKLKGKKEVASLKFKLSNGFDSLSIVKKKIRATEREMETHRDKLDQIKKLEETLQEEKREQRAFQIIYENYEREVARLENMKLIREEEIKERPASADSPSKSTKNSPKTRRPFGIGNINSQNVYFKEAMKVQPGVRKSKKKKNSSVSSYEKRGEAQESEYSQPVGKLKRTKTSNSVKGKKSHPPSLMAQKKKLQKMQTEKVELKKINTSEVVQEQREPESQQL